ncbi:MAG: hypothetical protein F6K42_04175 [Leptolyngbya sp. SIO1D8]|nr:hypothetical protein [Leptolyngbya sp. SIO1D8]
MLSRCLAHSQVARRLVLTELATATALKNSFLDFVLAVNVSAVIFLFKGRKRSI